MNNILIVYFIGMGITVIGLELYERHEDERIEFHYYISALLLFPILWIRVVVSVLFHAVLDD